MDLRGATGNGVRLRNGSTSVALVNTDYATFYPTIAVRSNVDNTASSGTASNRWTTVYAGTATINTSDEREKQQIQPIDEVVLRAWSKVQFMQFKFNDAVELKNDGARWHFGVMAQRVKDAFESEGLDAFAYGILCYDEWEDQYDLDGEGNEVLVIPSGNRFGIRYEEALALECAYLRSMIKTT
jgi:hypothetical protein